MVTQEEIDYFGRICLAHWILEDIDSQNERFPGSWPIYRANVRLSRAVLASEDKSPPKSMEALATKLTDALTEAEAVADCHCQLWDLVGPQAGGHLTPSDVLIGIRRDVDTATRRLAHAKETVAHELDRPRLRNRQAFNELRRYLHEIGGDQNFMDLLKKVVEGSSG